MQEGTIRTPLLITHEALQRGHDSEFFGRGSLNTFHRTIQEEWEARGKGLAEFRRHEHVPFSFIFIAISHFHIVLLEDIRSLAFLPENVSLYTIEDLSFILSDNFAQGISNLKEEHRIVIIYL